MSEAKTTNIAVPQEFHFMLRKLNVNKHALAQWFMVPEFVQGLEEMNRQHLEINNASVLELMHSIYSVKVRATSSEERGAFSYRSARQAMNQLEKALQH